MPSKFFNYTNQESDFLFVAAVKYTISSEQNLNKSHITAQSSPHSYQFVVSEPISPIIIQMIDEIGS
ncbi:MULTISPECIES: hypothetical protein [Providencia]|uniref:Uncharacterized protein n=2 Tax=Providencia TaxID=586 RepID=A0A264VMU9_PRORE|nr:MULTISPECIES: hypothetical protein [Providencia]MBN9781115.1 hypothetical protein [Vibrio parahaemolyticus]MRF68770.1 hypothetical protein [Escherichia coli]EHZ6872253.1 hypothetical protein [Providencia rettgeri]MBG5894629.1 hypothetical protein [Providencia rettgeri]MBG5929378.1 hypothetical protein [Providencia rettgeri]